MGDKAFTPIFATVFNAVATRNAIEAAKDAVVSAAIEWHYADEDDANAVRGGALRYSRAMVALHERVRALLSLREGTE